MLNRRLEMPKPQNEPVRSYAPGLPERAALKSVLSELLGTHLEAAPIVDGKEVHTGRTIPIRPPHRLQHTLGSYHEAGPAEVQKAIEGAKKAAPGWARTPADERAKIFLRAAELLAEKYRYRLNAATMLGQSKTCYQAEIDSACELVDFLRFNTYFQQEIFAVQPDSAPGTSNHLEYRSLEGFVFAVTPFNFTAIAGNLPTSAAMMGNVVLWKPASTAVYSGYFFIKLLEEAGLPPGVIQFLPGSGSQIGDPVLQSPDFAGVHFTGSTGVFQGMWKTIGAHISRYRSYPRIVGETGGKGFVFVHPSADVNAVCTGLIRGAFEYQGQKCSAASRAYIPRSLWSRVQEKMIADMRAIKMGDVTDFSCFMGAVIDKKAFETIGSYIQAARLSSECRVIQGGGAHAEEGYFIEPTLIETTNPRYRTMCEEIFGPVLTVHVYDDAKMQDMATICDETSPYALTGAVFGQDKDALAKLSEKFTQSAGNFYINNKPTGAVVNQQPFGGARGSGTNDKAGSIYNLIRWTSIRTVSETFQPPTDFRYPFLQSE